MNKEEIDSIVSGGGAFKVVDQGEWSVDLSTHTYDSHIVQCSEDLRFYRLEDYIRKDPHWLCDWSNAHLVEVVPVEKSFVHWKVVG